MVRYLLLLELNVTRYLIVMISLKYTAHYGIWSAFSSYLPFCHAYL